MPELTAEQHAAWRNALIAAVGAAGNAYVSPELHETFLPADRTQPVIKRTTYFKPTIFSVRAEPRSPPGTGPSCRPRT